MIELPEAVVIAQQVNQTLIGKKIVRAAANTSPHKFAWYIGDPASYKDLLPGKTIGKAAAYGNNIEIQADNLMLVISTPMKYHAPGEKLPPKHQLFLEFDDHSAVTCTVQMWGAMLCLPASGEGGLPDYLISKQKPSPLSAGFDQAYFNQLIAQDSGDVSAKEFLATHQRIPGLGNGVLQDILWTARIHPRRKISSLSEAEVAAMFGAIKSVLAKMVEQGGRDTEKDLFNCPGGYRTILSKNTIGLPCPVCGSTICKEAFLGGAIYFCPGCQPSIPPHLSKGSA